MKNFISKSILKGTLLLGVLLMCINNINAQGCYGATAPQISFTSSGGTIQRTIQHNCSGGTFSIGLRPDWLTDVQVVGDVVTAIAPAFSGGERSGSIQLLYNGSTSGGISVIQNEGQSPPPPCSVSGFNGSSYSPAGETKNYALSYSNCSTQSYYNFEDDSGNPLPSWITISQASTTQLSVTFAANNGTSARSIVIVGIRQDGLQGGIGGTFSQDCSPKTWYADSDGDGFRDPGSVGEQDCANRGAGWTQNTTVDTCPNDYNLSNVSKTWYADSDGDGFRDPGGATITQCSAPSGNWTENTIVDNCPNQYYTSNSGCDPNCGTISLSSPQLDFTETGGSDFSDITFPNGCTVPYTIELVYSETWFTATLSGNRINISCDPNTETSRQATIQIKVNGNTTSGLLITQGAPPPPPPCTVSGFSGSSFNPAGETKNYTLSYSNCSTQSYFNFEDNNGNPLPSWITINQTSTTQLSVTFAANNGTGARSIVIVGLRQDGQQGGIGGTFSQDCNPKTWYADSDGDGFRDPGSVGEQDCANRGVGWTQNTTVDNCPSEYSTNNQLLTWYRDTDGDGYKDANGETRQQCEQPSDGNWTSNPQPVDDVCPNYPNSASGSNGCNPNCLPFATNPGTVTFESSGGQQTVDIDFGCTDGYNIGIGTIPDNVDNWLAITLINGNQLNIVCEPGTSAKDVTVNLTVNGNSGGGVRVIRNATPPPPPDPCQADPIADITFGELADSKNVTVSYSGNCVGTLVLRHPYDPNGIPNWLTVSPPSGSTFTLSASINDTGTTRSVLLSPMMDDGFGNYTGMGVYFYVTQTSCLTEWYVDTDGDGLGDVFGEPYIGCSAPTNTGFTWVANNDDLCPEESGTAANQGCPAGEIPENYNTIASKGFDINGTMKGSAKAYFDELGKPIQNQSWNLKTNDVWASETLYDSQGRPAMQTLSAPIASGSNFVFKNGFVKQADNLTDYGVNDFTGSNVENPNPVGNATGTLGWYYSDANDREPYQDISEYPFVSSFYSTLNPGSVLRSFGGNKVDTNQDGTVDGTDSWIQSYGFAMRASQELSESVAFNVTDYDDDEIIKSVSRDVHGVENVVFTDSEGKTLAAARSGTLGIASNPLIINILEQGYVDVHIPQGITGFTVSDLASVTIYDLITEQTVVASPATLTNGFYRVAVNDLDNYDPSGNPITVTYTVNYYDYSLNEYDDVGRLTASYQPLQDNLGNRLVTTYEYDVLGQLIKVSSPDEGISEFIYRPDGQIRFSQNSEQAKVNEVSYTEYDALGRPVESGVWEGVDFSTLDGESTLGANRREQLFTTYDGIPSGVDLTTILPSAYQTPSFLSGNVAITSNDQSTTYYSYDIYGRVKWIAQDILGLGVKTLDYEYNPVTGLVDYVFFQKSITGEELIHKYTYDTAYQLTKVETSVDGGLNWDTHADYIYSETSGLKRVVLAEGVQAVDYVYNFSGQLKAINHPDQSGLGQPGDATDLFGMVLDYYNNDYKRPVGNINTPAYGNDLFNGNIKGVRWNVGSQPSGSGDQYLYAYQYDRNNWLMEADYAIYNESNTNIGAQITDQNTYTSGTVNVVEKTDYIVLGTGFHAHAGSEYTARIVSAAGVNEVGNGDYDVTGITYDANGNIQTLKRNKHNADNGIAMDDLHYEYKADKPNQLLRVEDAAGDVVGADDIGTQSGNNYVYNDIGQLIMNTAEGISYIYNASGLVTEVGKNGQPVVKFFYNDRNHRVKKESYTNGVLVSTTYYVRDAAGQVMAIYDDREGSMHLAEQPVYGNGRIGVAYTATNNAKSYVYELTDHLGNVRAVFTKVGVEAQLESYTDYYPFGMTMPGRSLLGPEGYRYAFQGQEKDPETGKEAFELRLWDARIGRWLTTDPYGQYNSPYLGMGNNPISIYDFDGGFADCPDCPGGSYENGTEWIGSDGSTYVYDDFYNGWSDGAEFIINSTRNIAKANNVALSGALMASASTTWANAAKIDGASPIGDLSGGVSWGLTAIVATAIVLPSAFEDDYTVTARPNDGSFITLYRGVSSETNPNEMFVEAQMGVAIPLGLRNFDLNAHSNEERHAMGDNYSIYTSWSVRKETARNFATNHGKTWGVILEKRFRLGTAFPNLSDAALKFDEGEWLVPGIVSGARTTTVGPPPFKN